MRMRIVAFTYKWEVKMQRTGLRQLNDCYNMLFFKVNKISICALWLSVNMKSVIEQRFFHEFAFDNKVLKTFVEFRIW